MAGVDWSLAAPRGGMLDALKAYQLGATMREQQVQADRVEAEYQRGEQKREALGRAIDPSTGQIDQRAAQSAYAQAGDLEGLLAYRQTLQGEHAAHAQVIGRLAKGATDQASWTAGLAQALQLGAITQDEAAQYAEFSPQARAAAMALGGVQDDDAYTLNPGDVRMRGGEVIARSPYKPEIITGADGAKYAYDPNDGAPPVAAGPAGLSVDALMPHFVAQESSGNYAARNPETGALGRYQVMPDTGRSLAQRVGMPWDPRLMVSDTPEGHAYQDAIGRAALQEAVDYGGGDLDKISGYYYGGSDTRKWGPRTRQYQADMRRRVLGDTAAPPGTNETTGGLRRISGPAQPKYRPLTVAEKRARGLPEGTAYQISAEGQVTAVGGQAASSASGVDRKGEAALRKEFDGLPEVKNFRTVRGQFEQIKRLYQSPSAQNDIGLIFSYMKMLDPTSVVREGEFATAQNAAGVDDRIRNMYNRARSGQRLNDAQRKSMLGSAQDIYLSQRGIYNDRAEQFRGYARDSGFEPGRVAQRFEDVRKPAQQQRKPAAPSQGWGKARQVR